MGTMPRATGPTASSSPYRRRSARVLLVDGAGHRWWSLDELASTTEIVYPFGPAALVADIRTGGLPRRPVQLPWHH